MNQHTSTLQDLPVLPETKEAIAHFVRIAENSPHGMVRERIVTQKGEIWVLEIKNDGHVMPAQCPTPCPPNQPSAPLSDKPSFMDICDALDSFELTPEEGDHIQRLVRRRVQRAFPSEVNKKVYPPGFESAQHRDLLHALECVSLSQEQGPYVHERVEACIFRAYPAELPLILHLNQFKEFDKVVAESLITTIKNKTRVQQADADCCQSAAPQSSPLDPVDTNPPLQDLHRTLSAVDLTPKQAEELHWIVEGRIKRGAPSQKVGDKIADILQEEHVEIDPGTAEAIIGMIKTRVRLPAEPIKGAAAAPVGGLYDVLEKEVLRLRALVESLTPRQAPPTLFEEAKAYQQRLANLGQTVPVILITETY